MERYIRNPDIFRTVIYSEPDAYSEHSQTSTMERFAKIARKIKKVLIFSDISGNETF